MCQSERDDFRSHEYYLSPMSVLLAIDTVAPRLQLALLRSDGTTDTSIDELAQGQAELIWSKGAQA